MILDKAYASMAYDTCPEPAQVVLEVWKETDVFGIMVGGPGLPYRQHFASSYVVAVLKEGWGTRTYRYLFNRDLRFPAVRCRRPGDRSVRHEKSLPLHERLAAERAIEHARKLLSMLELDMVMRTATGEMKPDDLYAWCKRIQCLEDEETH